MIRIFGCKEIVEQIYTERQIFALTIFLMQFGKEQESEAANMS